MRKQCPVCPDGNEWGANGPTGRACKTCGGKAYVGEDEPSASLKLSIALQEITTILNEMIKQAAGEELAFVLIVQADLIAQYTSNAKREDGVKLIESLLDRWKRNRADIPAHYNPDLKEGPPCPK